MFYLENIRCRLMLKFFLQELHEIPKRNYDDDLKEQQADYCKSRIYYYLSCIHI